MYFEAIPSDKGLATFTALIRPFCCVNSLVSTENRTSGKTFPTITAFRQSFRCVSSLM
ncbi:unnamed protein product [Gulo gulo]|uniref:Uncharacterized protein n=1 Tax=Gulo gulo TaxID=48420 RepID=A0A9X9LKL6_GULGU|nr:unnamed protein product [Gulo gulo]